MITKEQLEFRLCFLLNTINWMLDALRDDQLLMGDAGDVHKVAAHRTKRRGPGRPKGSKNRKKAGT